MFIKPAPGRMVRWPMSMRPLSDQGEEVPDDFYWQHLVQSGDVVVVAQQNIEPKKNNIAIVKKDEKDG